MRCNFKLTDLKKMGGSQTKCTAEVKMLTEKTKILQQKLDEMMRLRQVHEQQMMVHALKESEWKQDKRRLQREFKKQKTRNREMMERDEAVEKWKRLYLAIKTELDQLITKTAHQGVCGCPIEDELRREVIAKDETIQLLQAHIASLEQQRSRRERELDILRQSLRIIAHSNNKTNKSVIYVH